MISPAPFVDRRNCFDLIRLILALVVLNGHFNIYGGFPSDWTFLLTKEHLGFAGLAVVGFFGLSGYLVSASCANLMDRPQGAWIFVQRRFLRIMPGFWVCLLLTAFAISPLIAWLRHHPLNAGDFFLQNGPWDYVWRNWLLNIKQHEIAGVLQDAPYGAINGNLWSLFPEAICYGLTLGLAALGVFRSNRWFAPALLAFFTVLNVINFGHDDAFYGPTAIVLNRFYQPFAAYFTGLTLFCYRAHCDLRDWRKAVFGSVILLFLFRFGGVMLAAPLLVPFTLLTLGHLATVHLRHDISYGVYIYGSPMIQVMVAIPLIHSHYGLYVVSSVAATIAVAALSWWLVEARCMRLSHR